MAQDRNPNEIPPWEDVSTGTQTEEGAEEVEIIDDPAVEPPRQRFVNGEVMPIPERGFLANMLSRTLFASKRRNSSTQTEALDSITARGRQLSYYLIQELALDRPAPSEIRDDVYESFCFFVTDLLSQHASWFDEMVERMDICYPEMFTVVANELFEADGNNGFNVTWGRIISLYAFAVRLAKAWQDNPDDVETMRANLTAYVAQHVIPFVRSVGGWENLVKQFPLPVVGETPLGKAVMWSGLCMSLAATFYISTMLR